MKLDMSLDESEHQRFYSTYHDVRKRLKRITKFNALTIEAFLIAYHKFVLKNGKKAKLMTWQQLADIFQIYFNMPDFQLIDEVAQHIDPRLKEYVSPKGFVKLLNVIINGTLKEKIKFCFGVYEFNGNSYITKPRLKALCRNMIYAEQSEEAEDTLNDYCDFLLRKMDVDGDGKISFDDYSQTVEKNPCLLQFVGKLFPDESLLGWQR